jgi:hypothetical protein
MSWESGHYDQVDHTGPAEHLLRRATFLRVGPHALQFENPITSLPLAA